MSYATLAPAPIRFPRDEPPSSSEGIAPILIRIPSVERRDEPRTQAGPKRRRLRREVRGVLWGLLGIGLGWGISTYRSVPVPEPAIDPGPVLVRLSIEEEPSATAPPELPAQPIALKGFLLPSETR